LDVWFRVNSETDYRRSESEQAAGGKNNEGDASEWVLRRATRRPRLRLGPIQEMDVAMLDAKMKGRILFS
jgi:hypothetical protein